MTDWNDIVLCLLVALIVPAGIRFSYTFESAELRRRCESTAHREGTRCRVSYSGGQFGNAKRLA